MDAQQVINAAEAIPLEGEEPLSASQIFKRQKAPRLHRDAFYPSLKLWVKEGWVEAVKVEGMAHYRRATKVDPSEVPPYTHGGRSKSSSLETDDWFHRALTKLKQGRIVNLWMEDPKLALRKNFRGSTRKLVVLVPGQVAGLPRSAVVVSIIGSGSCVVRVDSPEHVANLVLAGMPIALASALMNKLHRTLKE